MVPHLVGWLGESVPCTWIQPHTRAHSLTTRKELDISPLSPILSLSPRAFVWYQTVPLYTTALSRSLTTSPTFHNISFLFFLAKSRIRAWIPGPRETPLVIQFNMSYTMEKRWRELIHRLKEGKSFPLSHEETSHEPLGSMVGLMATSKRAYTKGHLLGLLLPVPLFPQHTFAGPCLHRRPFNTSSTVSKNRNLFLEQSNMKTHQCSGQLDLGNAASFQIECQ